jgi:hypothetical protein
MRLRPGLLLALLLMVAGAPSLASCKVARTDNGGSDATTASPDRKPPGAEIDHQRSGNNRGSNLAGGRM